MLETILPVLSGVITSAKAMASFDSFRRGRKGDARAIIEELKSNSRLCFRYVEDGVDCQIVIGKFTTVDFDRLNKSGYDFSSIKRKAIPSALNLKGTELGSWEGKTTGELVENIYDKIKNLQSLNEFHPDRPTNGRRLLNIHKRILLLLRHIRD